MTDMHIPVTNNGTPGVLVIGKYYDMNGKVLEDRQEGTISGKDGSQYFKEVGTLQEVFYEAARTGWFGPEALAGARAIWDQYTP